MTQRLQILILCGMLVVFFYIINLMRKKKLDFKFALGWIFVLVCITILTIWPVLLQKISTLVGIASPVNMLFFFGFCLMVMIIFFLSMMVSELTDKVKKLSQEIAIIRKDMYDNYNKLKK